MGKNGKFLKWKLTFHRHPTTTTTETTTLTPPAPPPEYMCSLCNSILSEPTIVGSGHTFDRLCIQACLDLNFTPTLPDKTRPDFSTRIPNLALRSAIPSWCSLNHVPLPTPITHEAALQAVKLYISNHNDDIIDTTNDRNEFIRSSDRFLIDAVDDKPDLNCCHAVTELTHRVNRFDFNSSTSSSEESVIAAGSPLTPLPFKKKPDCWLNYPSSSSETLVSDEIVNHNPSGGLDEEFVAKFKSSDPFEQEQGASLLRRFTRDDEKARISLCTPRLLLSIRSLLCSSYENVQINAVAAIVNLSLEKPNKIMIVRSGIVPIVIDLLRGRSLDCQEHAAGAIFSLSLEDDNKTAIGVLGALSPLLNCLLRSESERTKGDSALALYHLSLVHSNRVKLVKLGAIPVMLTVLRSEEEAIVGRVVLVLCQLAASAEGKAAMLDGNAVEHLVAVLRRRGEVRSKSTRENCVAALYALSRGSLRFKALAKAANAEEVLVEVEGERAKEKVRRILMLLKGQPEKVDGNNGDEIDWEAILESGSGIGGGGGGGLNWGRYRVGGGGFGGGVGKSTEF